jgi:serine/threonine-protein kinase
LGRYQIHKELGKGAMGVVYLGSDPVIGRVVAIKTMVLDGGIEGDDLADVRQRFFREAESAGSLTHPHIVAIYDVGEEQGLSFIAMEFLKGRDLGARVAMGSLLPIDQTLSVVARVADALGYAHAKGVVHRDIKPGNIVFDEEADTVKVTDFGIASVTSSARRDTGLVMGTPAYLSPEHIAGNVADGRADLYSLGVTLYLLACGDYPFRGATLDELLQRILEAPPVDIRSKAPQLPECVVAIIDKALAKNPDARFQSGEEMSRAINLCRRSLSVFAS